MIRVLNDSNSRSIATPKHKILFYSISKTCEDPFKAEAYRITGILKNGVQVLETFDYFWRPLEESVDVDYIDNSPYIGRMVSSLPENPAIFAEFSDSVLSYCDANQPNTRILLCGYGNHGCDDMLLRKWMSDNKSDYDKYFFKLSVDLMGSFSALVRDFCEDAEETNLAWAAGFCLKDINWEKINRPVYRVELIERLYRSRCCKDVDIHTMNAIEARIKKNKGYLKNIIYRRQ